MLRIQNDFAVQMTEHARSENPNECCGVLAGPRGDFSKLFRMTNVDASPYRFSWDPKELFKIWQEMEDNDWNHRAVYHSHTHSEAYPSDTDIRLASWPDAYYIIISLLDKDEPIIRAFLINDGQVREQQLELY